LFRYRCYGRAGDIPIKGDFNGDGRLDFVVQRTSDAGGGGLYFINYSNTPAANIDDAVRFGLSSDIIVPGDYDGDGRTDIATLHPTGTSPTSNYGIYIRTANGEILLYDFRYGYVSDIPIPGDYNGDGKTDIAFYRQSERTFYIRFSGVSENAAYYSFGAFSNSNDLPAAGYNVFNRTFSAP
jgi:hypothetical protein